MTIRVVAWSTGSATQGWMRSWRPKMFMVGRTQVVHANLSVTLPRSQGMVSNSVTPFGAMVKLS